MSSGLWSELVEKSVSRSASFVAFEGSGSASPAPTASSAAQIAGLPAFVRIAILRPFGTGCIASASATFTSARVEASRTMPAFSRTRSVTASSCASPPVWEATARAPSFVVPDFSARIGLTRDTRRAASRSARASGIDSRWRTITRQPSSSP